MINLKQSGDLLKENVQAFVNTVNCVGVMGKGIALQFKMAYPDNFKQYKAACDKKEVQIGKMFITNAPIADVMLVYAKTDKSRGAHGISAFIVENGFEG